jgi:cell division protein FtsB
VKRAGWLVVAAVAAVGLAFLWLLPARVWLSQRHQLSTAERSIQVLSAQNQKLADRARELGTDAEIERLAREQYGLVKPGEQALEVLPSPRADAGLPPPLAAPAPPAPLAQRSLPERLWHDVQFWR